MDLTWEHLARAGRNQNRQIPLLRLSRSRGEKRGGLRATDVSSAPSNVSNHETLRPLRNFPDLLWRDGPRFLRDLSFQFRVDFAVDRIGIRHRLAVFFRRHIAVNF